VGMSLMLVYVMTVASSRRMRAAQIGVVVSHAQHKRFGQVDGRKQDRDIGPVSGDHHGRKELERKTTGNGNSEQTLQMCQRSS